MEKGLYLKKVEFKKKDVKRRLEEILYNFSYSESESIAKTFRDVAFDYAEKNSREGFLLKYSCFENKIEEYFNHIDGIKPWQRDVFTRQLSKILALKNPCDEAKHIDILKGLCMLYGQNGPIAKINEEIITIEEINDLFLEKFYILFKEVEGIDYHFRRKALSNICNLYSADKTGGKVTYFIEKIKLLESEKDNRENFVSENDTFGSPSFIVAMNLPKLLLDGVEERIIGTYVDTVKEVIQSHYTNSNDREFCREVARQISRFASEGADLNTIENFRDCMRRASSFANCDYSRIAVKKIGDMMIDGTCKKLTELYIKTLKEIESRPYARKRSFAAKNAAINLPKIFKELNPAQAERWVRFGMRILDNDGFYAMRYFGLDEDSERFARELLKKGYNVERVAGCLSIAYKNYWKEKE